jgi:hypothetical protein
VGDLDAALDYGLHGVRQECLVRAFGAMQGFQHEQLHASFEQKGAPASKLRELLQIPIDRAHFQFLRQDHPLHETLEMEIRVSRWLFDYARTGLSKQPTGVPGSIDELRRHDSAQLSQVGRQLTAFLGGTSPVFTALPEALRAELVATAADFFAMERTCLRAMGREQELLNERIRRQPGPPLSGDDLTAYSRRCTPALGRVLAEGLGITITADATSTILSHGDQRLVLS